MGQSGGTSDGVSEGDALSRRVTDQQRIVGVLVRGCSQMRIFGDRSRI